MKADPSGLARFFIAVLAIPLLALFAACPVNHPGTPFAAHGAGLFSWKGNLYAVGGLDGNGAYRAEVWRAGIGADGSLGQWIRDADLPMGLAFASCVAYGDMAYVAGGKCESGPVADILYTLINVDGSLGFSSGWERGARPLPEPMYAAAPVILNGRLFLLGGQGGAGQRASALNAAFWEDGQIGSWYESANALPAAGPGFAAAFHENRLWVVGGGDAVSYVSSLDSNAAPGPWSSRALDGGALSFPALASTADGLIAAGGDDGNGCFAKTRVLGSSGWALSDPLDVSGPCGAVAGGVFFALSSVRGQDAPVARTLKLSTGRAEDPALCPGSGVIKAGTKPRVAAFTGDIIRYTSAGYDGEPDAPTESSVIWDPAAPPSVTASASYAFRAFRQGAQPSGIVTVRYRARQASTFLILKKTISPAAASEILPYSLTESYSDGSTKAVPAVWFGITLPSRGSIRIDWADSRDDPAAYHAAVRVSLFEGDANCPAQDASGTACYALEKPSSGPFRAELDAGRYFLLVESADGSSGGDFGLSVAGS